MKPLGSLAEFWDKMNRETPDGDAIIPPIWKETAKAWDEKIPGWVKYRFPLERILILSSTAFFFLGFLHPLRSLLAFGAAGLISIFLIRKRVWEDSAALEEAADWPTSAHEEEDVVFQITLANRRPRTLVGVIVRLPFSGSSKVEEFTYFERIRPHTKEMVEFRFPADRGMGTYAAGPIEITVSDSLGLYTTTYQKEIEAVVKIHPKEIPLSSVRVERGGQSMHTGPFEIRMPGGSASFLGLREWRSGDSTRMIDWKRSARSEKFVVKEFERMIATDATIIFDRTARAHSAKGTISSEETLRDCVISIGGALLDQQVRIQTFTQEQKLDFGLGNAQRQILSHMVMEAEFGSHGDFSELAHASVPDIPPDSLAVLIFATANCEFKSLVDTLLLLDDKRVEIMLIAIDSYGFAESVRHESHLDMNLAYFVFGDDQFKVRDHSELDRLIGQLAQRSYLVTPKDSLHEISERQGGL